MMPISASVTAILSLGPPFQPTTLPDAPQPARGEASSPLGIRRAAVSGEDATALAMVLSELVQNAVEHGLADTGGTIAVDARRTTDDRGDELLTVTITDDGAGLPEDFRPGGSGLGTQIVQSLVQDLRGRITWDTAKPHGTRVRFLARLRPLGRDSG
jgi:two-component sensor histidine kinase